MNNGNNGVSQTLVAFVALAVCIGWLGSLAIGSLEHNWTPLTITTPVMLVLAGYAFGIRITKQIPQNNGGKDDG